MNIICLHLFCRFGVLFNILRLTADDVMTGFAKQAWWFRLLDGYNIVTWLVVLNLGFTGLLVSWVMKYADNIVKVSTNFPSLLPMSGIIQMGNC